MSGLFGKKQFFRSSSIRTKRRIYLDYASATPVLEPAASAAAEAATILGNPGSIHTEGVKAARMLMSARESIAAEIGCKAREIVFTSGGTEANNLAILGFARKLMMKDVSGRFSLPPEIHRPMSDLGKSPSQTWGAPLGGTHWVVSAIEHPSVLECFAEIERWGGIVTHVDPDARGIITPEVVSRALRPETVFISIGWGNGEIGTVQPLAQIARVIRAHEAVHSSIGSGQARKIIFHTDAGQVSLYRPLQVHSLGIDLLTLDSAKLYGPRGVGALFVGKDVDLAPIILGGKQERGLRAGTENIALVAGFAAAFAHIAGERTNESKRLQKLRDNFAREIIAQVPHAIINGDLDHAMPHMLNISIPNINSEYLVLALDHQGIALSTKSACREGEESRSHVVEAIASVKSTAPSEVLTKEERAKNTLRFSFGRSTTKEDLKKVLEALRSSLAHL